MIATARPRHQPVGDPGPLTCPICLGLVTGAVVTRCGHTYCDECLLRPGVTRCPICKADSDSTTPNYVVRDLANAVIVRCRWCPHTAPRGTIEAQHEAEACPERPPRCRWCGRDTDGDHHEEETCLHRPVSCPDCHDVVAACRMRSHHEMYHHRSMVVVVPPQQAPLQEVCDAIAVLDDGTVVVASTDSHWRCTISRYDGRTGALHRTLRVPDPNHQNDDPCVSAMVVLRPSQSVVLCTVEGMGGVLDRNEDEVRWFGDLRYNVPIRTGVAVSETEVALGDDAGHVWVHSIVGGENRQQRHHHHGAGVNSVAALSTTLVSGGDDGHVKVWQRRGVTEPTLLEGHSEYGVWGVVGLGDGCTVVSVGHDGLVKMQHVNGEEPAVVLGAHEGPARFLAVLGDGETVVSGGRDDRSVRLWNSSRRQLLLGRHTNGPVVGIAVMPDGYTVVSADQGELRWWRVS